MESRPGQKVGNTALGFSRVAILTSLVVGAACSDSTGPAAGVRIVPATPSVALQQTPQGATLNTSVTLTNTTQHPVAYSSCGISLEKRGLPELPPGKSGWETVWSRICYVLELGPAALTSVFPDYVSEVLQPGQSITIPIIAAVGKPPYPNFTGEPGRYRFHVSLFSQILGRYYPFPYDSSVSDSFLLLPAP